VEILLSVLDFPLCSSVASVVNGFGVVVSTEEKGCVDMTRVPGLVCG